MGRVARFLALVCSVPLALPQGWCCMRASFCPFADRPETAARTACCGTTVGCPCCGRDSCGASDDQPTAPAPKSPPKKCSCPCADRHLTLPVKAAVEQPTASVVLFLPMLAIAELGLGHRAGAIEPGPPPKTPPLYMFHCVWRC